MTNTSIYTKRGKRLGIFLIRSNSAPNGVVRFPVVQCYMVRFGPHWSNSKITWANTINALIDVDTKMEYDNRIKLPYWNSYTKPQLDQSQYGSG